MTVEQTAAITPASPAVEEPWLENLSASPTKLAQPTEPLQPKHEEPATQSDKDRCQGQKSPKSHDFSFSAPGQGKENNEEALTPRPVGKPSAVELQNKPAAEVTLENETKGPLAESTNTHAAKLPASPKPAYRSPPAQGLHTPSSNLQIPPSPGMYYNSYQPPSPGMAYNSYQFPGKPMYPPYTPHPCYYDPSGQFSRSPSARHSPESSAATWSSPPGSSTWSPDNTLTPSPSSMHSSYTPSTQGTESQHSLRHQESFWPSQRRGVSLTDKTNTWRRYEPAQSPKPKGGSRLSVRQMTSLCFQASSKGSQARLPKAAVKTLVEHQLKAQEPVHAPWYRHCSGGKSPAGSVDKENFQGTGVWIPKLEM